MAGGSRASRRQFVIALGTVVTGGGALAVEALLPMPTLEDQLRRELSALTLAAGNIGRAYFSDGLKDETNPDGMLHDLADRVRPFCDSRGIRRRCNLTDAIKLAIRKDFEEGHMCPLDGWLLSRTEVLICALSARLTAPGTVTSNQRPSSARPSLFGGIHRLMVDGR